MGMAASQARLLMLTARIHDVEYEAQSIQNAKLQLATQQDEIYQKYMKALDAQSMTFTSIDSSGNKSTVIANFNNLFSINAANTANGNHYLLVDSRNRVVVDDAIYEGYQNFSNSSTYNNTDNAYAFAFYMVEGGKNGHDIYNLNLNGTNDTTDLEKAIQEVFYDNQNDLLDKVKKVWSDAFHVLHPSSWPRTENDIEWSFNHDNAKAALNLLIYACGEYSSTTPNSEQTQAYNEFINYFWSHYGQQVFNKLADGATNVNNHEYNSSEFNYYVRIYNAIQEHGGACISIDDFNGPLSTPSTPANTMHNAANNAEWLTAMIQSGQLSIKTISIDNQGNATINGTSLGSDSDLTFTNTTQYDKTAMAKAEAEYEHELKLLDNKDKKFDMALSKLDAERTALTKQYDSMKKVVSDNIERTFGIFS